MRILTGALHIFRIVSLSGLMYLFQCSGPQESVVPELILDVPDQIKPAMRGIMLRVVAGDIFPVEIDLTKEGEDLIIPTGKDRHITAEVKDSAGTILATGNTVCDISPTHNQVTLNLFVPPPPASGITATLGEHSISLSWQQYQAAPDREFDSYRVYRSQYSVVTELSELVGTIKKYTNPAFTDKDILTGQEYFYRVYVFETSGAFSASKTVRAVYPEKTGTEAL